MLINQEQQNKNSMSRDVFLFLHMFIAWIPIRGHLSGCVWVCDDCTALHCSERWAGEHRCDF